MIPLFFLCLAGEKTRQTRRKEENESRDIAREPERQIQRERERMDEKR